MVPMPHETSSLLLIRDANEHDIRAIESMVADFVKGHPTEKSESWRRAEDAVPRAAHGLSSRG